MAEFAEPLQRLIAELEKLPGVGARTAERLAYHLLKIDRDDAMALARAIRDVKERLKTCQICFNMTDGELCRICSDRSRDPSLVCVVEHVRDLIALEKVGSFQGLYHVLGGKVAPSEGKSIQNTTLGALLARVKKGVIKEVILATNPDAEGDATSLSIGQHLHGSSVKVTRLARGIPVGGSIEFANVEMLREAMSGRQEAENK